MTTKHYQTGNTLPANDFADYGLCLLRAKGKGSAANEFAKGAYNAEGIQRFTKAVGATTASELLANADYQRFADGFSDTLVGTSVFETILSEGVEVGLDDYLAATAQDFTAAEVGEGNPIAVGLLTLGGVRLDPRKVAAMLVMTDRALESKFAFGLVRRALKRSVTQAQDRAFLAGIGDTASSAGSSAGSGATNAATDVKTLLDAASVAGSRPFLVVSSTNANALSTFDGTQFAQAGPQGGVVAGVPYLVSDELASTTAGSDAMMLDAESLIIGADPILLTASQAAAIQMLNDPTNAVIDPTATDLVSLFQNDSTALRVIRRIGFNQTRTGAVAILSGVAW